MKYSKIKFDEGVAAIVKSMNDNKIHTVANLNQEGGECSCCQLFSKEYLNSEGNFQDNIEVLKVVNIKTLEIIYDSGIKYEN